MIPKDLQCPRCGILYTYGHLVFCPGIRKHVHSKEDQCKECFPFEHTEREA